MWRNERKRTDIGMKRWIMTAVILILVCVGVNRSAAAEGLLLNRESVMVYMGDEVVLADYVNEEFRKDCKFAWMGDAPEESVAVLTEDGIVKTKEKAEVQILVTYMDEEGNTQEETLYITIVAPETLTMEYGSTMYLEAVEMYQGVTLEYASDEDSVLVSETGMLTAQGFKKAKITAKKEDGSSFQVAEVSIMEPELQKQTVIRAVGTTAYEIGLNYFSVTDESETLEWKVTDGSIATIDKQGLNALRKGSTMATVTLTAKNKDQKELQFKIIVTDPKLSETKIIMAAGTTRDIMVTGADVSSEVIWEENLGGDAYFSAAGKIYAESKGTASLKVTVDGKTLACTVQVSDPEYADLTIILYKGKSNNLKLKGLVKGSKVTYASNKKSVLTISGKGKMKAKKTGHAIIKVNADGKKLNLLAEISSKKGYQASKKAIAISKTKTKYSQAKRMSKNHYDCSSLVSRVYRQYGVYFGSKSGWSPTAADIGKWCARNKKVVARRGVSYKKLLPGDLIFFSSGKNGRYKNITHVEMYTGGATDVSASSSNNKVIHYGYSPYSDIVLIARPTK